MAPRPERVVDLSISPVSPYWLPSVSFKTSSASGEEDIATIRVDAVLDAPHSRPVRVDLVLMPESTAEDGVDVTGTPATLTFQPGQTTGTFFLAVANDPLLEGSETVVLGFDNPVECVPVDGARFTYTILDTGDIPPEVSFATPAASAAEDAGRVTVTLTLSRPYGQEVAVSHGRTGGTAGSAD